MAVIKMKPTSPGHRGMVKISRDHLHKGEGYAPLLEPQFQKSGRNNNGHITTRHKGGGHKHHYRVVDFVRNKDGIPAKVERIEYDPNRTAHIALVCYADGERRYIIAPRGLDVGATIMSGAEAPIKAGNTLPIRNIPVRPTVRGVAMNPVDHPHGGGEGRTGEGQVPVSPWNTMTKGYRTRNNKRTQTMIVARRKK